MSIKDIKENKKEKLLDTAYELFTEKGIVKTSIQDIANKADIGKGTFYLYFKDKYELQDILIAKKSHKLFTDALAALKKNYISNFSDQIIFIINYIIDELTKKPALLKFIAKNLSWGISNKILKLYEDLEDDDNGVKALFTKGVKDNNLKIENPEVTLYMIIELVSSTCFSSILYNEPLPISKYKPYLYKSIRTLIEMN